MEDLLGTFTASGSASLFSTVPPSASADPAPSPSHEEYMQRCILEDTDTGGGEWLGTSTEGLPSSPAAAGRGGGAAAGLLSTGPDRQRWHPMGDWFIRNTAENKSTKEDTDSDNRLWWIEGWRRGGANGGDGWLSQTTLNQTDTRPTSNNTDTAREVAPFVSQGVLNGTTTAGASPPPPPPPPPPPRSTEQDMNIGDGGDAGMGMDAFEYSLNLTEQDSLSMTMEDIAAQTLRMTQRADEQRLGTTVTSSGGRGPPSLLEQKFPHLFRADGMAFLNHTHTHGGTAGESPPLPVRRPHPKAMVDTGRAAVSRHQTAHSADVGVGTGDEEGVGAGGPMSHAEMMKKIQSLEEQLEAKNVQLKELQEKLLHQRATLDGSSASPASSTAAAASMMLSSPAPTAGGHAARPPTPPPPPPPPPSDSPGKDGPSVLAGAANGINSESNLRKDPSSAAQTNTQARLERLTPPPPPPPPEAQILQQLRAAKTNASSLHRRINKALSLIEGAEKKGTVKLAGESTTSSCSRLAAADLARLVRSIHGALRHPSPCVPTRTVFTQTRLSPPLKTASVDSRQSMAGDRRPTTQQPAPSRPAIPQASSSPPPVNTTTVDSTAAVPSSTALQPTNTSKVVFECKCVRTRPGDELCVAGGVSELGDWDVDRAVRMDGYNFPIWSSGELSLPSLRVIEFKYVLRRADGGKEWETFDGNREVTLSNQDEPTTIKSEFGE
ncbi:unnamed protein product [Vitrella brassicaformis CCMP3155]|uniref:CBM20 domain-containing protein n=1 Tax=Vitrella brassicaformis (strain CCMP3155) TaxID=1169540 RepID=A0A0G4EKF6_VITBC|nr:unnamed protein product [Vitrella brassicaformis CCMP3155]|eukprot:CEL97013.1 unnamed protein product [Vitrella brassicaformis CCMP3155]